MHLFNAGFARCRVTKHDNIGLFYKNQVFFYLRPSPAGKFIFPLALDILFRDMHYGISRSYLQLLTDLHLYLEGNTNVKTFSRFYHDPRR